MTWNRCHHTACNKMHFGYYDSKVIINNAKHIKYSGKGICLCWFGRMIVSFSYKSLLDCNLVACYGKSVNHKIKELSSFDKHSYTVLRQVCIQMLTNSTIRVQI